jgi:hypothetical protein
LRKQRWTGGGQKDERKLRTAGCRRKEEGLHRRR